MVVQLHRSIVTTLFNPDQCFVMIEFYTLRRYNVGLVGLPNSYMPDNFSWVQVLRNPLELLVVRSYHQENRRSHQNSQLKPVWAGLVLG